MKAMWLALAVLIGSLTAGALLFNTWWCLFVSDKNPCGLLVWWFVFALIVAIGGATLTLTCVDRGEGL